MRPATPHIKWLVSRCFAGHVAGRRTLRSREDLAALLLVGFGCGMSRGGKRDVRPPVSLAPLRLSHADRGWRRK